MFLLASTWEDINYNEEKKYFLDLSMLEGKTLYFQMVLYTEQITQRFEAQK